MGQMKNAYLHRIILPERRKALVKPRSRCENNIKDDLKEIRCRGVNWFHLEQDKI
jgi:hypothetical protein